MTVAGNFEHLQYSNFETNFLKSVKPFQETGVQFLAESTNIDNATFRYKTALSEANVKTNRMGSTKWTYHEEQSFGSNYFLFPKMMF